MEIISTVVSTLSNWLFGTVLIWLLLGAGAFLTWRTRAVQLRHLGSIARAVAGSRSGAAGGISSFQAFAVGLACRVGTGNIVGVALALILGGPGAVFWMWVVALLGTATAFTEATLGQLFKVERGDGTFRGGPAHYIARGLRRPVLGGVFAVVFMIANGLAMPMVQANAMTAALDGATRDGAVEVGPWWGSLLVVALVAPVLLGGLRSIARAAELIAPLMAAAYLALVAVIILTHPAQALAALGQILSGAFGLRAGLAGVAGGVTQAVLNGVRRGLFSNEAGLGGSACAAGSATVAHPARQGFIQSFGVLVDTLLVCTATALAILIAGAADGGVYTPGVTGGQDADAVAGTLTQTAIGSTLGAWTTWPMTVLVLVLAYSTILGAFSYAEVCLDYLTRRPWAPPVLRASALACAFVGGVAKLTTVWSTADVLLGAGAIINLVGIVMLSRWATGVLRDWEAQRAQVAAGALAPDQIRFVAAGNPHLPGELPGDVWGAEGR